MKRAILNLIALAIVATAATVKAKPVQAVSVDPDYCGGIACTEQTDTCCDESIGAK